MGKKDFTMSTDNVLDDFFSQSIQPTKKESTTTQNAIEPKKEVKATTAKKETNTPAPKQEVQVLPEEKQETPKKLEKKRDKKYLQNECRFNFRLDPELADFVNNHLWLTRNKNYTQYFNKLVRQSLAEILELPKNTSSEEIALKWEEYKKTIS